MNMRTKPRRPSFSRAQGQGNAFHVQEERKKHAILMCVTPTMPRVQGA
jgi:hypothetical protein